jgi:hypothetical protein
MSRVLVVGSYPPVPGAGSAATVAAVRRALADGDQVEVVSPRPSAAHRTARIKGGLAGWVIAREGRRARASALVLCVEPGMPIPSPKNPRRRRHQAFLLACGFRAFERVTLVIAGDTTDATAIGVLCRFAHEVVVADQGSRLAVVQDLGLPDGVVRVDGRFWEGRSPTPSPYGTVGEDVPPQVAIRRQAAQLRRAGEPTPNVTPYGPPDWAWYEQPRRVVGLVGRRLLGRHADPVRAALQRAYRKVRPV